MELAPLNNPIFLSTENDGCPAAWQERAAYGAFLPRLDAKVSAGFTEAGTQRIWTLDFGSQRTDWYSSSYNLGLTWTLSGSTMDRVESQRESCEFQNAISAGLSSPLPGYPRTCSQFTMTDDMRRDIISIS